MLKAHLEAGQETLLEDKAVEKYLLDNIQHFKKQETRNRPEDSDISIRGKTGTPLVKQLVTVMAQEMELDHATAAWVLKSVLETEKHLGDCLIEYDPAADTGYDQLSLI